MKYEIEIGEDYIYVGTASSDIAEAECQHGVWHIDKRLYPEMAHIPPAGSRERMLLQIFASMTGGEDD